MPQGQGQRLKITRPTCNVNIWRSKVTMIPNLMRLTATTCHYAEYVNVNNIPAICRCQLHWLPVRERVIFKHALLVFKALHGLLPPYLADDCQLLADTGRRQLRSSDVATCSVLRTHSSLGDRCFAVAGPRTWNSLPIKLRQSDLSLEQFRRLLNLRRICLAKDYGA